MSALLLHEVFGTFEGRAAFALATVAVPTALLGALLHVRRMALLTDAMAHAALPGVLAAWFLTGSLHPAAIAAGAAGSGVATAWFSEALARRRRIRPDAAIAAVFSIALAGGVVALSMGVDGVHLDVECLLFGNLLGIEDHSLALSSGLLLAVLAWVGVERRAIERGVFDPDWARVTGLHAARLGVPLALATAVGSVVVFETVGAITGVALFVVPGALAHRLARRFGTYLAVAVGANLLIAAVGLWLTFRWDLAPSGALATTSGVLYAALRAFERVARRNHDAPPAGSGLDEDPSRA